MGSKIIRSAIAGIGGYGQDHHQSMLELENEHRTKVLATCDLRDAELEELCKKFQFSKRGVKVYTHFEELLANHQGQIDLLNISTPITAHGWMHSECVKRGISCYLEKPPTLDPDELRVMIERDSQSEWATQVGFAFIAQECRMDLKRQILSGEFGRLVRVSFQGLGVRPHGYYARNNWAGRLFAGQDIVLDSCCGNAMSHHLHNILFFAGQSDLMSWAAPARVEAELYRANAIEGADTVFARGELDNGVEFRIAASHACTGNMCKEVLTFEKGEIMIEPWKQSIGFFFNGRYTTTATDPALLVNNLRSYLDYLGGNLPRPLTLLSDCRPMVELNALLYIAASRITSVKAPYKATVELEPFVNAEVISGIESACRNLIKDAQFPSETALPWARAGGSAQANALKKLRQSLELIRENSNFEQDHSETEEEIAGTTQ